MGDACCTEEETFRVTLRRGIKRSTPHDPKNSWDSGTAIESLLLQILPRGTQFCHKSCSGGNETCLPRSITVRGLTRDDGRFEKVQITRNGRTLSQYKLDIRRRCRITIIIVCRCTPFPD